MRRQLGYATIAILEAIRRGNRFGLDIMRETGLLSGTVYVTLGRAERAGYLRSQWEDWETARRDGRPRRRHYRLTKAGEDALVTRHRGS